jgi:MFS family permease
MMPFFAHTLLVQTITFVLRPTAIYKALELDVPTQYLGAMGASFAIVPLFLAVPSGHAADRFGERRVMLLGSVLVLGSAVGFVVAARPSLASWGPASSSVRVICSRSWASKRWWPTTPSSTATTPPSGTTRLPRPPDRRSAQG